MTPAERQSALVDDLSVLPDAFERLNYLVAQAGKAEALPENARHPADLVEGCQAELWLTAESDTEQRLQFRCHSDAPTIAALASLFCHLFSDSTPAEVVDFEPTALEELGLNRALTPNRQNGARQIVAKIKAHARAAHP